MCGRTFRTAAFKHHLDGRGRRQKIRLRLPFQSQDQGQHDRGMEQYRDTETAGDPSPVAAFPAGWGQRLIPTEMMHAIGTAIPASSLYGSTAASSPDRIDGIAAALWASIIAAMRAVPASNAASSAAAS